MAQVLVQLFIDGLGMGLIYVLLAVGFILIMSIPRIFFLVYGEVYMLGAFIVWFLMLVLKLPFFFALFLAVSATATFGGLCYRLIFLYVQYKEQQFLTNVVAAIGLTMIAGQGCLLVFGTESRGIPSVFPGMLNVVGLTISVERVVLIALSLAVALSLFFFLQKTNTGLAMRAVSFRADVAALQGVNPTMTYLLTTAIGCAIAGFAGGVMGPVFAVSHEMKSVTMTVFLVIMLGGMNSMIGAVFGGLILGQTLSYGYYFIGTGPAQIFLFILIGIMVFFKPGGLFAKVQAELQI